LPEALVRSAFVQIRIRNPAKAVTLLYRVKDQPDDRDVTYWAYLFRGRACEDQDRVAEAAPAYRKALDVAPLAQSAGAALVALAARWGDPSGAATWAAALKAAPADTIDPWTHFSEGDGRFFAAWRDQLAKAAR
jgi:hypothetical protein